MSAKKIAIDVRAWSPAGEKAVSAVIDDVNRAGGICGRRIDLRVRDGDDSWNPAASTFARLLALPPPGIDSKLDAYLAGSEHVPLVGTNGVDSHHFGSSWVWPVNAPPESVARIAVDHAYRVTGARTFAVIYDGAGRYGSQAADAARAYAASLPGATVKLVQEAAASDAIAHVADACGGGKCDAVVWAMPGAQAADWVMRYGAMGRLETDGLMLTLSADVAKRCDFGTGCDTLRVWTPFTPPVGSFLNSPAAARYAKLGADPLDPFAEGAYVGAQLLVEALKRAGPYVTRDGVQGVLDVMTFEPGLTAPLSWHTSRAGNTSARAVKVVNGSFDDAGTGWYADPAP